MKNSTQNLTEPLPLLEKNDKNEKSLVQENK